MQPNFALSEAADIELEAALYGGTVTIQRGNFGRQKHAYFWREKGVFVPGATSILQTLNKPALLNWAAGQAADYVAANLPESPTPEQVRQVCDEAKGAHNRTKEEAGDIGSQVHKIAENLFRGVPIEVPEHPLVLNGLRALQEWIGENEIMPIDNECISFSKSAFYAGTFDLLASINGKLTLLDIKTSKYVYDDHKIQLGGYRFAWEEEHRGERIEQLCVLHIDKNKGKPKAYTWADHGLMQLFTDTFLRVKAVSDNLKKIGVA